MKIVIKIGGSLIQPGEEIDLELVSKYAEIIRRLKREGHQLVIVVGGGVIARKYIEAMRKLEAPESICDLLGIKITRLNAYILISAVGDDVYPKVPESLEEAISVFSMGKIVVMGGLQPGQSTNAVAALLAESIRADILVNATTVDGVYTAPPETPGAKKLAQVTTEQLMEIMRSSTEFKAGEYRLFDPLAILIVRRAKLLVKIVDGRNPQNVLKAIKGEKVGTTIIP
ncbi:MAG: UMP kinase [Candidatus Asgardarchaeum californiense]|nr:MAG: UMP kinase [Candidatus Asgardarchaeum californiense]